MVGSVVHLDTGAGVAGSVVRWGTLAEVAAVVVAIGVGHGADGVASSNGHHHRTPEGENCRATKLGENKKPYH